MLPDPLSRSRSRSRSRAEFELYPPTPRSSLPTSEPVYVDLSLPPKLDPTEILPPAGRAVLLLAPPLPPNEVNTSKNDRRFHFGATRDSFPPIATPIALSGVAAPVI